MSIFLTGAQDGYSVHFLDNWLYFCTSRPEPETTVQVLDEKNQA
jgi:hypothetical protein